MAAKKSPAGWVEQKNGAVVRRAVGYRRYEGLEAAAALGRLYAALRLFVNFSDIAAMQFLATKIDILVMTLAGDPPAAPRIVTPHPALVARRVRHASAPRGTSGNPPL